VSGKRKKCVNRSLLEEWHILEVLSKYSQAPAQAPGSSAMGLQLPDQVLATGM